jgi:uncharacterized repeat protein (TIGR03803 family)
MSGNLGCAGRSVMLFAVALLAAPNTCAQGQFRILHNFGAGADGAGLWSPVVMDKHGNLYGSSTGGGAYGEGTVYQLRPSSALPGGWTESILHSFSPQSGDGWADFGGVTVDASGNLYGGTIDGGANGRGVVLGLTPGNGGWRETILYNFCSLPNCADGAGPSDHPILDPQGNLYGTAGVVFQMSPAADGWTESVLYTFCTEQPPCVDGWEPGGSLVRDAAGNLYGTTFSGGYFDGVCQAYGCGVVYEVTQVRPGVWRQRVLYAFEAGGDGWAPAGALTIHDGALYGGTNYGGGSDCGDNRGCGTIFEVAQGPGGEAREAVLYSFGDGANGLSPIGPLVFDRSGNIYGVTAYGGGPCECGVLFRLIQGAGGAWQYTVLHTFSGADGSQPSGGLVIDSKGNVYGAAVEGGKFGGGVVFEYSPQ